jgi:hypothetical protein
MSERFCSRVDLVLIGQLAREVGAFVLGNRLSDVCGRIVGSRGCDIGIIQESGGLLSLRTGNFFELLVFFL